MRRSILVLAAMLSLSQIALADFWQTSPSGHIIRYRVYNGTNYVRVISLDTNTILYGHHPDTGNLIIPSVVDDGVNNYTVKGIYNNAFRYTRLTSVTLPNTITTIGSAAFGNCSRLSTITIPNSVTSIGDGAFEYCSELTSITLSDSLTAINTWAFYGCTGLASITIPNSVTLIDYDAFRNCTGLTSVTLSNSLATINCGAFQGCTGLTSITIPNSVTSICADAFQGCSFSQPVYNNTLFCFLPRNYSGSYSIPNGITKILEGAIENCPSLTSVILPNSVMECNSNFSGCENLNSIIKNDHLFVYLPRNYSGSYSIPTGIRTIGYYAFCGCTGLTEITIPRTVRELPALMYVLSGCPISTVNYYADSATATWVWDERSWGNLDWHIPYNNYNNINIGNDVKKIPDGLFEGLPIKNVSIPNSVECIGSRAFYSCHALRKVELSCSLNSIDDHAFKDCENLDTIALSCANPPVVQASSNTGISSNVSIIVPCVTSEAYRNTPFWSLFTNYVEDCFELCMVGVEGGRNVLYWNNEQEVAAYNLYRESVVAGEYELMASVSYDSASRWVDVNSRPRTRSYRYKISTIDADSNESSLSHEQKTMHLAINQGLGGRWNLQWTPYEGAEYTTYIIYRGTTLDSLVQIDIMPADGNTSYTDEEAPEGDVFYQVGIVMRNSCSSATKSASISRSNIATNSSVGINDVADVSFNIYSHDNQIVINGTNGETVRVFDMMGRMVAITNGNTVSVPTTGVYMVKIGNLPARRVAVI